MYRSVFTITGRPSTSSNQYDPIMPLRVTTQRAAKSHSLHNK